MGRWLSVLALALVACGDGAGEDDGVDAGPDAGSTGWASRAPVARGAIQETATVAIDGKIYVLGGFSGQLGITDAVQVYDVASDTWSEGVDLPQQLHHINAAVVDDVLYIVGALETGTFLALGRAWKLDPARDTTWTPLADMPAGTERGSSAVGVIDGRIYLAGGFRGGTAVSDVSAYDVGTDTWITDLPALPEPRDHGCGVAIDGAVWMIGGRAGTIGAISPRVWSLEPGGDWVERTPMPTARGGTACAVVGDRAHVVGGEGNAGDPSGVFPQHEAYDPAADAWQTLEPMRTPRHGMGAAAWDGALYVPGGATRDGFGAVDTHEVFRP